MVRSVDEVKARLTAVGLPTVQEITNPKRWVTMLPDAVKVEFTEEPSQKAAIIGHHLHLSTNDLEPLRAWYVKTFGGVAETRRGFPSAVFDGGRPCRHTDRTDGGSGRALTQTRSFEGVLALASPIEDQQICGRLAPN